MCGSWGGFGLVYWCGAGYGSGGRGMGRGGCSGFVCLQVGTSFVVKCCLIFSNNEVVCLFLL